MGDDEKEGKTWGCARRHLHQCVVGGQRRGEGGGEESAMVNDIKVLKESLEASTLESFMTKDF